MAKTDTQITVRVTNEFKSRLEAQAQKEHRSVANLVHKVMEDYLTKEEPHPLESPTQAQAVDRTRSR